MKVWLRVFSALFLAPIAFAQTSVLPSAVPAALQAGATRMVISPDRFRFSFWTGTRQLAGPGEAGGIEVDGAPLGSIQPAQCSATQCSFAARSQNGDAVAVRVMLQEHHCAVTVTTPGPARVLFRTAGVTPAYGMADHAAADRRDNTDLTGFVDDHLLSGKQFVRLVSNFVIFPRQGMAEVLPSPQVKIARLTQQENAQGVARSDGPVTIHYFFGSPHQIYAGFARLRQEVGAPLLMPKYEMFGVGWEAFGALGWNTNQQTIGENVDRYLALGFPLRWLVIGSGFWPAKPDDMHETTSFGLFDKVRYPSPREFFQRFHNQGLKVLLGLRITFITTGPFAAEGVEKHYFLQEDGKPKVFKTGWPALPCYLLNAQSEAAVDWYMSLVAKWKAFGIDGFKEDFFGYGKYPLRDDKVDPVNRRLMAEGYDLIERNGYLASDGDLQRIDDFNYNQDQDRGPVNALALAYSGLPLVYPDIVGGTFGENYFDTRETPAMAAYIKRNAQWASLHSSMSVGQPPWTFKDPQVAAVMLKAAQTHERLHPYMYSQAVRFIHDGYPWTMTPLPVAFPGEPGAYGRENRAVRGYEWMIGDALLATPLYGDDYATAEARDIYLPAGKWIDYESGQESHGPAVLKNFQLPVEKTPLFVGGTGIVFEQNNDHVVVRIYPIKKQARTGFWSADGKTESTVELKVRDWKRLKVVDTTRHQSIPWKTVRFAAEFPLTPGHSYLVE